MLSLPYFYLKTIRSLQNKKNPAKIKHALADIHNFFIIYIFPTIIYTIPQESHHYLYDYKQSYQLTTYTPYSTHSA